jgi:hypothetical protein
MSSLTGTLGFVAVPVFTIEVGLTSSYHICSFPDQLWEQLIQLASFRIQRRLHQPLANYMMGRRLEWDNLSGLTFIPSEM